MKKKVVKVIKKMPVKKAKLPKKVIEPPAVPSTKWTFVFDAQPPAGWSYPDHIRGDENAKPSRPGLVGYMKQAAKRAKGFCCIVLDPMAASLLDWTDELTIEPFGGRGKAVAVWQRRYLVFVNPDAKPSVCFAKTFDGPVLARLVILNV